MLNPDRPRSPACTRRITTPRPYHRATASTYARLRFTSHQREFKQFARPGLPLARRRQGGTTPASAFPRASNPAITRSARQGGDGPPEHGSETQRYVIELASKIAGLLDTCDLVSHSWKQESAASWVTRLESLSRAIRPRRHRGRVDGLRRGNQGPASTQLWE